MLKIKRFLMVAALIMCLGSTAYATTKSISVSEVGWTSTASSTAVQKTDNYTYAVFEVSSGPIGSTDYVYAYASKAGSLTTYNTETVTYTTPCSKNLYYKDETAAKNSYKGNNFQMNLKLQAYSLHSSITVKGYFTP